MSTVDEVEVKLKVQDMDGMRLMKNRGCVVAI